MRVEQYFHLGYQKTYEDTEGDLYGVTLKGPNAFKVWNPEIASDLYVEKLIIKMVLLGAEAKPGELNVLEVEALGLTGSVKIPIALLEIENTSQIILDLSFPKPPVTFTLIRGSGPVHIVGHHYPSMLMKRWPKMPSWDSDSVDESDESDEEILEYQDFEEYLSDEDEDDEIDEDDEDDKDDEYFE